MHIPGPVGRLALPFGAMLALIVVACGGGTSAGWTYAPLGPTPAASAAPTSGATGGPSETGEPSETGGPGTNVAIVTPADNPLGYDPTEFTVPAGASVTIDYTNESNLPHDVQVFAGADNSSEVLGATEVITGPGAQSSMSFTAPSEPGDYFFWCSVHRSAMTGSYQVE